MARIGFAVAVADAHPKVIEMADWTTTKPGGRGAAREVCELIMQANGTLEEQFQRYLPS
jgi:3-deoxy-D-manno-octulosonate 8-phosphate phosphatase (KDO 8-P phosphatase)